VTGEEGRETTRVAEMIVQQFLKMRTMRAEKETKSLADKSG
jgi:hypothetical protein